MIQAYSSSIFDLKIKRLQRCTTFLMGLIYIFLQFHFMNCTWELQQKKKNKDIKFLTEDLITLPFKDSVSIKAAQLYRKLRLTNQMIEFRDIFIAATCIVNELHIVTLNKKHFNRIEGLKIVK